MDSKTNITVSKQISGDQDADATLFGGVLTNHASRLFEMTQVRDKNLRFASLDLIGHLLRQGQVNPNETVPFLLALQGDVEEDGIRSLALKLLMIEGEKRPDMLRQRVCAGVKQANSFQKSVYPDLHEVSALVKVRKNGTMQTECVFGAVFKECIGSIKKQRQGLIRNLLSLFDLQNRKNRLETNGRKTKSSEADAILSDLPLLSFTSQVLAYLPYVYASDPLYIIHNISSTLALQGADLLDRLASFLRPYDLASSDDMDENNVGEDDLEIAAQRHLPRHAKEATRLLELDFDTEAFSGLCSEAGALALLLRMKTFLRKAYNLSESRCLGYNPEAKERIAEKAISRASILVFDSKLAMQSSHGDEDTTEVDRMIHQYAEFRQLMRVEASVEVKSDGSDDDEEDEKNSSKRKRIESVEDDDE
jgi:cohesin loading factor subunit SCC2